MRIALQSADFATDLSLVRSAQKAVLFVGFAVADRPLWLQIPSHKKTGHLLVSCFFCMYETKSRF
jgi:hypothetical protein